jgi:hypothetical protein
LWDRGRVTAPLAAIDALLLDLDGVLYVEDEPVPGAREAIARLRTAGLALRKEDFAELVEDDGARADAVIVSDLGAAFAYDVLNRAFRAVMQDAELVALQKNRYWQRADGLSLDVGPFVAALEYATRREAAVVGTPAARSPRSLSPYAGARVPVGGAPTVDDLRAHRARGFGPTAIAAKSRRELPGSTDHNALPPVASVAREA